MDRSELVRAVAERNKKLTLIEIDQVLKDALDIISERLGKKEIVHLAGFGSFSLTESSVKPLGKYVTGSRKRKGSNV